MAASTNTAAHPKYGLRNDSDGLRIVLPSSAFGKLIPYASTFVASSSGGAKHMPYDVFINHCGQDVKHTLASDIYDSLHATGLRVFLDKDELKHGDFFPKVLQQAITSASLHIAIFSEHYAQSLWCLTELAVMVETGTTVIPIFYGVEPSDLRWAAGGKGKYADAFSALEKKNRYSSEELQRWKRALHVVSFCHGSIIKNIDDKHRVVKNLVNRVIEELNVVPLEVAKHPVGLDEAVKDFDTIACQSIEPIQIMGIWGMGGSGKTTLAKELYNRKCSKKDKSSFLFDLRDATAKGRLHKKQKTLLKDLGLKDAPFDNVDAGKGILKNRLRSICVFIILDDVDHTDQLDALLPARESLGRGSLIIVTTRDANVLREWGISAIYQMRPLNATHAKQLFCWNAFLRPSPPSGFKDLVEKFLNACGGLPLSLKILGGQLYGKTDKDYWQGTFNKFSQISHKDIKERLKVSYDALDKPDKEMFLDAACLFIGHRKSAAIAAWDAEYDGLLGWEMLFNKCFVEVDKDGFIRMHDHLRDLGRDIANGQPPHRLWSPQQKIQVHFQQEAIQIRGMASTIGVNHYPRQGKIIIHTSLGERSLAPYELGLKIFFGNGDFINQERSEISRELVWLQCNEFEHKNLPSWLSLKNLRILELFNPRSLQDLWERDADAPLHLRELAIEGCNNLRVFPTSIAHLKNLKKILLIGKVYGDFDTFSSLPQDFCHLQSLEHLAINGCRNLSSLPSNFGRLTNLQHLNLKGCTKLKMLPDSFKKLTILEYLSLKGCGELIIKSGLHILENMTKLRYLNLNGCWKLEELRLPEVASLTELYLKGTSLKELPANISQLTKLTKLVVGSKFLTTLPTSLGNLSSLSTLEIRECKKLEFLPESLEHLNFLRDLNIEKSGVKCLPKSLIHLQSLDIMHTPISELSFGSGCMLKRIDLMYTKVSKISISGDCCPFLERLEIYCDTHLRELETLPVTLKTIIVYGCHVLQDIRGVHGLKNLKKLEIKYCEQLDGLPCFTELVSLEIFTLEGSSKVKKIAGLQELRSLRELRIELDELPSLANLTSLKHFALGKCNKWEKKGSLRRLKLLEELNISDCPELEALPNLAELTSLKEFRLGKCHKLEKIEGLESLTLLETLNISDWPELDGVPNLEEITSLKEFRLEKCHKLEKIEGLESLTSLEILKISDCPKLDGFPNLSKITSLKELRLGKCHKLEKIEGLESPTLLEILKISDCREFDGLPNLAEITSLKKFRLKKCHKLEKIEGLESLTSLETLNISDCPELDGLPNLAKVTSLKDFRLENYHKLEKIEGLESLTSLETLNISDCSELDGLPNLAKVTSLKYFRLEKCHKLEKIEGLESLTSLKTLNISDCPELDGLPKLKTLKTFRLEKWHKEKIEGLESMTSLETLKIIDCPELDGLPNLAELTSLKNFGLEKWHKEKIEGLESLTSLETLNISDCPELNGLPSLAELTYLKKMDLRMCHKLEKIEGLERLRSFKKLEVHTHRKAPCIVRLEQFERLESLVVVAEDRSVVEPFISKMQKWPSEVIMCTRAVFDVGSLKTFFEELPNVSVLHYSDVADDGKFLNLRRPESSANANANAILICFIIDWVNPDCSFRILPYTGNSFDADLSKGKWVWMGVFTQPSCWLRSNQESIWAQRKNSGTEKEFVKVKVEEAWSVMGEEGSIIDAFHQLLRR